VNERAVRSWSRIKKWMAAVLILGLLGFLGLNFVAWRHARALCLFDSSGRERTPAPEKLTFGEKAGLLLTGAVLPKPANASEPTAFGLPSETVRFTNPRGNELEAWFIPGTSPTAVLLFHGYAASKSALLPMARILHDRGHPMLLVDFSGSGGSSGNRTTLGYWEAEDVQAARAWMEAHRPAARTVLYGVSMGGAAVLRASGALKVPADGLIVESTFPDFRETVAMRFELMKLPSTPAADLLLFWGGVEMGLNPWKHNPADYARGVSCPVLVMTGSQDLRVPLESARRMAGQFPKPARFEVIEGGHQAFAETQPALWNKLVSQFIETL